LGQGRAGEALEELVEVVASELPPERLCQYLVVGLETDDVGGQPVQ
jgi:hypothetical protein